MDSKKLMAKFTQCNFIPVREHLSNIHEQLRVSVTHELLPNCTELYS